MSTKDKTDLLGKVAIVTGADAGIGRASAILLAERGARVVVADRGDEGGAETARLIGGNALFVHVDVANEVSVKRLVQQALDRFGRLDDAHKNAGVAKGGSQIADAERSDFDTLLGINLTGIFLAMKAEIPAMLKTGGGSIINMSSVAGVVAQVGQAACIASKHGVIGLTKAAAVEYSTAAFGSTRCYPAQSTPRWSRRSSATIQTGSKCSPQRSRSSASESQRKSPKRWLGSLRCPSFVTGASLAVDVAFSLNSGGGPALVRALSKDIPMTNPAYFTRYENFALDRIEDSVLTERFHTTGQRSPSLVRPTKISPNCLRKSRWIRTTGL